MMNQQLKAILLTVLTLSLFIIALVELSGVSRTALFNKLGIEDSHSHAVMPKSEQENREEKAAAMPKTEISFQETNFDFGTIQEGEVVTHSFKFRNTGASPLLIANTIASCGCTTPSFSKDPVLPGGEGEITVRFDSKGRKGMNRKNVIVVSNAQQDKMSIGFTAQVE